MITPCDSLVAENFDGSLREAFGFTASGQPVYTPFRPSCIYLANALTTIAANSADPNLQLPLSDGMQLLRGDGQLQLHLDDIFARRYRRVFGYIGEIQLHTAGAGTVTFTLNSYPFFVSVFLSPPLSCKSS